MIESTGFLISLSKDMVGNGYPYSKSCKSWELLNYLISIYPEYRYWIARVDTVEVNYKIQEMYADGLAKNEIDSVISKISNKIKIIWGATT